MFAMPKNAFIKYSVCSKQKCGSFYFFLCQVDGVKVVHINPEYTIGLEVLQSS